MKKDYQNPELLIEEEVKVENDMLLGSTDVENPGEGEGSGEDLVKERGTYGNLWD